MLARTAGFLYLVIIVAGAFGYTSSSSLIVWDDAAVTASNILPSEQLWRLGLGAMLVMLSADVAVSGIFYVLFRPVDRTLSLIGCLFRLVLVAVVAVSMLARYLPLLLLGEGDTAALETDQLQALALVFVRLFDRGFAIALVFFGFHCLVIGWLVYRSTFLPRILGVLLAIAGLCYLVDSSVYLAFPALTLPFDVLVLSYIVEMALCLWLIVKGVDEVKWKEQAGTS